MNNYQLKLCPFCGGAAELRSNAYILHIHAYVRCRKCGVSTMLYKSGDWDDTCLLAINAWNRRANDEI